MTRLAGESRLSGNTLLLLTVVGWGLGWPIMKLLLVYWPPLFARGVSGLIAGSIILVIALWRHQTLGLSRQQGFWVAVCSLTNVFAWMGLPTIAMLWLSAGEGALLVYTFPIWVALFSCWKLRRWPRRDLVLAMGLSVLGLFLLLYEGDVGTSASLEGQVLGLGVMPERLLGFGLALVAAMAFALGVVCFQPKLQVGTLVSTGWQILLGCGLMVLVSVLVESWQFADVPFEAVGYLAYMTLVPMLLCYLAFFGALKTLEASWAAVFMLLTPVVGVLAGALMLGEPLGLRQVLAVALVLSGVLLTLLRRA